MVFENSKNLATKQIFIIKMMSSRLFDYIAFVKMKNEPVIGKEASLSFEIDSERICQIG